MDLVTRELYHHANASAFRRGDELADIDSVDGKTPFGFISAPRFLPAHQLEFCDHKVK